MQCLVYEVKDRCGEVSEDHAIKCDLNAMVRNFDFILKNLDTM